MKKPQYLVHPSQARTIDNPAEAERLLAMGWVLAKPRPKTKMASRMRAMRRARRAEGWAGLTIWLEAQELAAVRAAKHPGETYSQLLMRLVNKQGLPQEMCRRDADKVENGKTAE